MSVSRDADSVRPPTPSRGKRFKCSPVMVLVTALLSTGTVGALWWSEHKYEYIPKRWGVVVPGKIYRSGQLTRQMLGKTLSEHGIKAIIDLQLNDLNDPNLQWEMEYAAANGIRHYRFGLGGDGTGDADRYVGAVAVLIDCVRNNEPVLVHCGAGTQRTGGIIACYRLLVEKADAREVSRELKAYDWEPASLYAAATAGMSGHRDTLVLTYRAGGFQSPDA